MGGLVWRSFSGGSASFMQSQARAKLSPEDVRSTIAFYLVQVSWLALGRLAQAGEEGVDALEQRCGMLA